MARRLVAAAATAATLGFGCQPAQTPTLPRATHAPSLPPTPTEEPSTPPLKKPRFESEISVIDRATRNRMVGSSWRSGCPVPIENLRLVTLTHWGYDARVHAGEMVLHEEEAESVVRVFRRLFRARFTIKRMELIDEFGADDNRSMAANNTSAFNCRRVTGGSGWSQHAYGWAIDINPIQNPYVDSDGTVLPPAGAEWVERSQNVRGMIHDGDVVVRAFAAIGWEWGGHYQSIRDYQHFSATGG